MPGKYLTAEGCVADNAQTELLSAETGQELLDARSLNEEVFDIEAGTRRVLSFAHKPRGLSVRDVCDLVAELESDRGWVNRCVNVSGDILPLLG